MRRLCLLLLAFPVTAIAQESPEQPLLVLDAGGHTARTWKVLFRPPQGKELITVSDDKTIRIWDVTTGESIRVLRPPVGRASEGKLYAAAVSPDGKMLAVAGYGFLGGRQWIYVISLDEGRIERVLKGHTDSITALAFCPTDPKQLASSGHDQTARIWNLTTGVCEQTLKGHTSTVHCVAYSPDGRRLATASADKTARIWSLPVMSSEVAKTGYIELAGHTGEVNCVAWSPDGLTLATGADDESIRFWEQDGSKGTRYEDFGGVITSMIFTPFTHELLFTHGKGKDGAAIISVTTGVERVKFTQHTNMVRGCALSPDGKLAATCGGDDHETYIWHTEEKTQNAKVKHRLASKGRVLFSAGWSPDNKSVAWGNTFRGDLMQAKAPLERTFRLTDLEIGDPPTDKFQRAQLERSLTSLTKVNSYSIAIRRDEMLATFRLANTSDIAVCCSLLHGDRVVVGSSFGLFLVGTRSGTQKKRYYGHVDQVYAVAPSPDERYFLSASADQTLRVWDPDKEEPLLSMFFAGNEWIAWTPEGYYAASPGGETLLGVHINNGIEAMASYYAISQFHKSLYRPDVIKLLLATGNTDKALAKADEALGKTSPRAELSKLIPPAVTITTPEQANLPLSEPSLLIRATAKSVGNHPVTAMRLLLDGRPYQGRDGLLTFQAGRLGPVDGAWTVEVPPGQHQLTVQAESAVSTAFSRTIQVALEGQRGLERIQQETKPLVLPSLYVLAVGVSAYPGNLKLNYAARDADALAKVCEQQCKALFRQVKVKLLTDKHATRKDVLNGLTWVKNEMTQNDVALISFAGHGARDNDGKFYLLPVDVDPKDLLVTGVSGDQLKSTLASVPGKVVFMLDACHSGAVDGEQRRSALAKDFTRDLATGDVGAIVMCSSMGREFSLESATVQHGLFTQALVEGLTGKADYNKDGVVYLSELDLYITDRVKDLSKGRQHPVTAKPTGVRSFPLSKATAPPK